MLGGALARAMRAEVSTREQAAVARRRRAADHRPAAPGAPFARAAARALPLLGPAFVAAVAYIDPGNFATNIAGGAKYGYLLLWVVLSANLMAMLIQTLSAKVGIATGKNLPELCRDSSRGRSRSGSGSKPSWSRWPPTSPSSSARRSALNLLFGVPLFVAGLMTGVAAFAILALQNTGYRRFELVIAAMFGLVLAAFLYQTVQDRSGRERRGARASSRTSPAPTASCSPPASSARP